MNSICKRLIDLTLAIIAVVLAAPIMGVIALFIWLESPGDVIFAQERLGLHAKRFRIYKFRKFPIDWGDKGPGVTLANDARMTRVGAVLERTKLDELPQLWNIIKGDMSFVGPRPENLRFADAFEGRYAQVLNHAPGIFGPTQVFFTDESTLYPADEDPEAFYRRVLFPQKAELDLAYFEKENCLRDIEWIIYGVLATIRCALQWRRFPAIDGKALLIDIALTEAAWVLANVLRFSGLPEGWDGVTLYAGLWVFPLFLGAGLLIGKCYPYRLNYFAIVDAVQLVKVITVAWVLGYAVIKGYLQRNASLYVAPLGWFVLVPLLMAPRVWRQLRAERTKQMDQQQAHRIVIYGVDGGGVGLASWITISSAKLKLMGFLDDDPGFRKRYVLGYPILGSERDIPTMKERYGIDEIWMTHSIERTNRQRIEATCHKHRIRLVILSEKEPFTHASQGLNSQSA